MRPSEGVRAIDEAIGRGRAAILAAADMFQGTAPPPPWPSPELYKAIDDAADAREKLDVFVRHGDPDFNAKTVAVANTIKEIQKRIDAIDRAAAQLKERGAVVATQTASNALKAIKGKIPTVVALGVVLYLLSEHDR